MTENVTRSGRLEKRFHFAVVSQNVEIILRFHLNHPQVAWKDLNPPVFAVFVCLTPVAGGMGYKFSFNRQFFFSRPTQGELGRFVGAGRVLVENIGKTTLRF